MKTLTQGRKWQECHVVTDVYLTGLLKVSHDIFQQIHLKIKVPIKRGFHSDAMEKTFFVVPQIIFQ